MGIFLDIIEQTAEKYGQFIDQTRSVALNRLPPSLPEKSPVFYECPFCGDVSLSVDAQKQHIIEKHANQHVYVKADNKVINDVFFVEGSLSSLDVVILGNQVGKVKMNVGDAHYEAQNISGTKSLMKHLKGFKNGVISIFISVLSTSKEYTIYCNEQPEFTSEDLDRSALEYLFIPLAQGKAPDFSYFNSHYITKVNNKLERRYAAGLHDYSLAFFMALNKENAKEYFESALSNLLIFNTNFAMTARRILALRMNSFRLLYKCRINSRFYLANQFFNVTESRYEIASVSSFNDKFGEKIDLTEYGVFIDEFTETFLSALNAYYNNDFNILAGLTEQLNKMILPDERNNQDKLFLLHARIARKIGKITEAKEYYQNLIYNPLFADEAEELLK